VKIYLASQSPRRQALLQQIGIDFDLLLPHSDEDAEALEATRPGEAPLAYVKRVVRAKAAAAALRLQARKLTAQPVLVADTTVALGRQILGKPVDAAEHAQMLRQLADRTHRVITGIAVMNGNDLREAVSISQVGFAPMSEQDIARYVQSGEGMGKAGGYAIQGAAAAFVTRISGSYSGIMGLPLRETVLLLQPPEKSAA
jgi:septum formation protein